MQNGWPQLILFFYAKQINFSAFSQGIENFTTSQCAAQGRNPNSSNGIGQRQIELFSEGVDWESKSGFLQV